MKTRRTLGIAAGLVGMALSVSPAFAQPAAQPAQPPGAQPPVAKPDVPKGGAPIAPPPDSVAAELAPQPGGLTPDQVGAAAARTSYSVRAKRAELDAAAARVDQAFVAYFPRVSVTATYTRLSPTASELGGPGALLFSQAEGDVGPCKDIPTRTCVFRDLTDNTDRGTPVIATSSALSFDTPLNSYSVVASLGVPISDYVLRLSQAHASARGAERARRLEADAEALTKSADAKIAYFNWVRARGQVVVTLEAIAQAKAHVSDAKKALEVGVGSPADVVRLEAQVASAEQVEAEARALVAVAEEQLRLAIHAPAEQSLTIGTDVLAVSATPPTETLGALQDRAVRRRLELRALDETQGSLRDAERVSRAGYYPRLDGFADVTIANPNQRVFPQQDQWDATWDLGLRLSWVLNDSFTASGAAAESRARTRAVTEQKAALADAVRLEVASAYADVRKAAATIEASDRGLVAALESQRVSGEQLRVGRATAVQMVDAETEVTRARLRRLDARIGLAIARTRLAHAVGDDVADARLAARTGSE